jgi:hypothetical protein
MKACNTRTGKPVECIRVKSRLEGAARVVAK